MNISEWSSVFKALGHEQRLKIATGLLLKDQCDVSTMQKNLKIPQATLSQHLAVLKNAGILICERQGTRICYQIASPLISKLIRQLKITNKGG